MVTSGIYLRDCIAVNYPSVGFEIELRRWAYGLFHFDRPIEQRYADFKADLEAAQKRHAQRPAPWRA